jgi:LacI family transcriptional regulator
MTRPVVNRFTNGAPTIRDVAARAGVAPATVSNVLTGRRQVAASRRQRVLEAVAALGYQPNHLAASLRRRQTHTVGIVVPDLTNPFFATLVRRIEELAAERDYQILLVDSNEAEAQEAARIRALLARRIDGLIVVPARDEVSSVMARGRLLAPTVLVDRGFGLAGFDTIAADNIEACRRGTQHLLALGHRDIALLVSAPELANIRDRIEGYRQALAAARCLERERVLVGGLEMEGCRAALEQELRRADRPTAVFAATYPATLGAIKAVRALELAFPEDVSLLGFDDFDWMTVLRPYVSTIGQPVAEMASEAWRLLNARFAGSAEGHARLRLPCRLQVRESTRPPGRRPGIIKAITKPTEEEAS